MHDDRWAVYWVTYVVQYQHHKSLDDDIVVVVVVGNPWS